jgi:hypothetical protein
MVWRLELKTTIQNVEISQRSEEVCQRRLSSFFKLLRKSMLLPLSLKNSKGFSNVGKEGRRNGLTSSRRSSISGTTPEKSSRDSPFWTGVFAISVLCTMSAISAKALAVVNSKKSR